MVFGPLLRALGRPEMQWVTYGVLMILVVYFLPEGIVPAVRRWWQGRASAAIAAPARRPPAEAAP